MCMKFHFFELLVVSLMHSINSKSQGGYYPQANLEWFY